MGERTSLNFLQRLSGIATNASSFVKQLEGSGIKIIDTRKTTPGHRVLENMQYLLVEAVTIDLAYLMG